MKHVLKITVAVKNTLETMKKIADIVKLDSLMKIAPAKNLEKQRKFFSTTKRKQKYNVKYVKHIDKKKAFIYVAKYICRGDSR